jgi:hypothetical protein
MVEAGERDLIVCKDMDIPTGIIGVHNEGIIGVISIKPIKMVTTIFFNQSLSLVHGPFLLTMQNL